VDVPGMTMVQRLPNAAGQRDRLPELRNAAAMMCGSNTFDATWRPRRNLKLLVC
jgi:hypothetical protein